VCGDYFAALRAYRQMQAQLGPAAAQAARHLSSNSSRGRNGAGVHSATARSEMYDEMVSTMEGRCELWGGGDFAPFSRQHTSEACVLRTFMRAAAARKNLMQVSLPN